MKVLRQKDYPEGKFSLAFIGYDDEMSNTVIELTHNWDTGKYDHGGAFGHIAIEVDDVYKACEDLAKLGINITRKPGPMKHGTRVIAFCEDPDGYKVELNEPIKL